MSTNNSRESLRKDAAIFKALGHPIRLWMVKQLLTPDKEFCVADFVEALDSKYATISQHLKILRNAGIIIDDKRGKTVFYKFTSTKMEVYIRCVLKVALVPPQASKH